MVFSKWWKRDSELPNQGEAGRRCSAKATCLTREQIACQCSFLGLQARNSAAAAFGRAKCSCHGRSVRVNGASGRGCAFLVRGARPQRKRLNLEQFPLYSAPLFSSHTGTRAVSMKLIVKVFPKSPSRARRCARASFVSWRRTSAPCCASSTPRCGSKACGTTSRWKPRSASQAAARDDRAPALHARHRPLSGSARIPAG